MLVHDMLARDFSGLLRNWAWMLGIDIIMWNNDVNGRGQDAMSGR